MLSPNHFQELTIFKTAVSVMVAPPDNSVYLLRGREHATPIQEGSHIIYANLMLVVAYCTENLEHYGVGKVPERETGEFDRFEMVVLVQDDR